MTKTKAILVSAGILAAVVAAGAAWAQKRGGHHMMKHMIAARIEEAEDYVQATPQQRAVIDQARDEVLKAFETRMKNKETHAQVAGLLAQEKLDVDSLDRIADQRADDVREMGHLVVAQVAKVHAVLTPEQRQKLLQRFKERHGEHGGFGGE
jgi:Spy/CpxP family protein refolding chaperone